MSFSREYYAAASKLSTIKTIFQTNSCSPLVTKKIKSFLIRNTDGYINVSTKKNYLFFKHCEFR
jgi:hypothetical protein